MFELMLIDKRHMDIVRSVIVNGVFILSVSQLFSQVEVLVYCGDGYGAFIQNLVFDKVTEGGQYCSSNVTTTENLPTVAQVQDKDVVILSVLSDNIPSDVADAISLILQAGGILFLLGENGCCVDENNRLDDLLFQLGSSMSNQNYTLETFCSTDPLSIVNRRCVLQDVDSFRSQWVSPIFEGDGLILVQGPSGEPCFVEECFNGGTIYYISDITWLDPPNCSNNFGEIIMSNVICNCPDSCNVSVYAVEDELSLCEGDPPFILNVDIASKDDPVSIDWSATNGGEAFLNSTSIEDPTVSLPLDFNGTIWYYIEVEGASGDCLAIDSILLEVAMSPDINLQYPDSICTNDQGVFVIADPEGGDWSGAVDENGFIDPSDLGSGTHVVSYSYTNESMCYAETSIEIFIGDTTVIDIEAIADPLCISAGDIELVATPEGGAWDEPVEDNIFNPLDVGIGLVELTYNFENGEGCMTQKSIEVLVVSENESQIIGPDSLCVDAGTVQYEGILSDGDWGGVANSLGIINTFALGAGLHEITYSSPPEDCNIPASLFVEIFEPSSAELDSFITACNSGPMTMLDFDTLVLSGDTLGSWIDLDSSGATGDFPVVDFEGVNPGIYQFVYVLNSIGPCENVEYNISAVVEDCDCPSLALDIPDTLCQISINYNLDLIKITEEEGSFSIINDPGGMNPATLDSNVLQGAMVDAGVYTIQFDLANSVESCADSVVFEILVTPSASAELVDTVVCNSDSVGDYEYLIDLYGLILYGDTTGCWEDLDGSGASGSEDSLDFSGVLEGVYTFSYTTDAAIEPCENVTYLIEILVLNCECTEIVLSGSQIFCNDDLNVDVELFNISGQEGSWMIVDDPGGMNPAELMGTDLVGTGSDAGIYVLEFTLDEDPPEGCANTGQVEIEIVASLSAEVAPTTQICNTDISGGQTDIDFTEMINGGVMTGVWEDVDDSGASGVLPNLDFSDVEPGVYTFSYTLEVDFPCTDSVYFLEVEVIECLCPPILLSEPDDLCDTGGELNLEDLLVNAAAGEWSIVDDPGGNNPAQIVGNMISSDGSDAGEYTLQYTLVPPPPEECPDSGVVTLTIIAGPEAGQAEGEFAVCEGEQGTTSLFDLIENNDADGMWTQTGGTDVGNALNETNGNLNYTGLNDGIYTFEYRVEGEEPCGDDAVEVSIEIYANPIADAGIDMNLDCSTPQLELGGASSIGAEYEYSWEGPSGALGGGITQMASEAGVYTITVIHTETGCSAEDGVILGTQGEIITSAMVEAEGIGCEADADGVIRILEVEGGTGPYMYSINGSNFTDQNQWTGLEAGAYEIVVEDIFGCQYLIETEIEDRELLELSIGGIELELDYGEEMNLEALLNISEDEIAEIIWSSGGVELCNGCTSITIIGTKANMITVNVRDSFGCEAEASFSYNVVINENVYIPTIFSPNGDGLNDEFYVYGGESAVRVVYMRIYTRWGELVYEARDLPLTDPELGWDGTYKGELMNPNVFSYEMEILFDRGIIKFYSGDITLIK